MKETDEDWTAEEANENGDNNISKNDNTDIITTSSAEYDVISPRLGNALCCVPCLDAYEYESDGGLIIEGTAYDIIVVQSPDGKLYQNSEFLVSFFNRAPGPNHRVVLEVSSQKQRQKIRGRYDDDDDNNDSHSSTAWFPVVRVNEESSSSSFTNSNSSSTRSTRSSSNKSNKDNDTTENNINNEEEEEESYYDPERYWGCCHPKTFSGKITDFENADDDDITTKLSPFLKHGKNPIRYLLLDKKRVVGVAHANIFLWSHNDSVVVSDIDGTITKSTSRGVIDTILTDNYQYCHDGVCSLLSDLSQRPNAQTLYVTSRPIRLASHTRQFLKHLRQGPNNNQKLPEGPILGFNGNIPQLLIMELVSMKTHHFKADLLWRQVVQPFRQVKHSSSASPIFVAGFGNTIMDVQAYHMAGIDLEKIYLINKKSKLSCFDSIEKEQEKDGVNTQQELINLTRTSDGLFSATIGIPMPRKWYKSMIGSKFDGYTDQYLKSHILSHRLDNDGDDDKDEGYINKSHKNFRRLHTMT